MTDYKALHKQAGDIQLVFIQAIPDDANVTAVVYALATLTAIILAGNRIELDGTLKLMAKTYTAELGDTHVQ